MVIWPTQKLQGSQENYVHVLHTEKEKPRKANRVIQDQIANKFKIKWQMRIGGADTETPGKGSLSLYYNFLVWSSEFTKN